MVISGRIRYTVWLMFMAFLVLGTSHAAFADRINFLGCQLESNYLAVYTFEVSGINPTDQVTAQLHAQYFVEAGQGSNIAYPSYPYQNPYPNPYPSQGYNIGNAQDTVTAYFSGPGTYQIWNASPYNPWPGQNASPNYPWPMGTVIQLQLTVQVPNGQSFGPGYDTQTATCNVYP
jgi:hypothetical protein